MDTKGHVLAIPGLVINRLETPCDSMHPIRITNEEYRTCDLIGANSEVVQATFGGDNNFA